MVDVSTSKRMKKVKSKNTSIELTLRKALWKKGYRYHINCKDVFGTPDICFKGKKIAIFCDSEFWHGKKYLEGKAIPKINQQYWIGKFERNISRDCIVNKTLSDREWIVVRFWENDLKRNLDQCVSKVEKVFSQPNAKNIYIHSEET